MAEVVVEPEAEAELLKAAVWYESRHAGLAREFLEEVTHAIARISSRPSSFPPLADLGLESVVRRALLRRFPYALVFVEKNGALHVIAAAHARQEKSYWLHRVLESEK